jgi:hypothetical protein
VLQAPREHRSVASRFGAAVALGGNFALVGAPGSVFTAGIPTKKKSTTTPPLVGAPGSVFTTGILTEKK